ncbi:putative alcohol oxidase [Cercophora newfieldiana]|uniref:Alcohol oxidase n=1 Tax=Cercophora newfieldiana TaxID=92897 RepID=A0AA39Y3H7_9PEZI|nr:putative alcohol oxidase [Cercophora newfieldiana]
MGSLTFFILIFSLLGVLVVRGQTVRGNSPGAGFRHDKRESATSEDDVDIIFAGGGTAACVTAGRLAHANPHLNILLVEGGRNNQGDPTVVHPALFAAHLAPGSTTALFYRSKPSKHVGNREVIIPAGGMLGGGSSINLAMYSRAQAFDYDAWKTPGWAAKDIIPLCDKIETYHPGSAKIDMKKHGNSGPIHISDGGFRSKCENDILRTITRETGWKELADINDFSTVGGFMKLPRYVSPDGKRQDAAHRYIHPLLQQDAPSPNLRLLLNSSVTRVLFDKTTSPPRAIGIEYRPSGSNGTELRTVRARKMVVITAGALGSPQILERSGVGNSKLLQAHGIPAISDLPGVGENYQDHHLLASSYKTSLPPDETLDALATGRKDVGAMIAAGDPQLGWNSIDVAGKLRPEDSEAKKLGPAFYDIWKRDWKSHPKKPLTIMNFINTFVGNFADVEPDRQHISIGTISLYPYSRGSIHISKSDTGYDFDSGFLSSDVDVKTQMWGYKRARAIARKLPFFEGEVAVAHPKYPVGSAAGILASSDGANKEIVYTAEDDAAIELWIRQSVGTTWHSLGTCAMKPRKEGGVVDSRLNVYGTKGLKVADLSIAPENIGANVGNTAFAIGEKAALIIAEDLGLH